MKTHNFMKLLAGVLTLAATLLFISPASAQLSADATCVGQLNLGFSPALRLLLPRETAVTGSGSIDCVFTSDLSNHTAEVKDIVGIGDLACVVTTGATGTALVEWADAGLQDSEVIWESVNPEDVTGIPGVPPLPTVARVFVLQGEIVSGQFAGDTLVVTYNDLPGLEYIGDCLFANLSAVNGPVTAIFAQLPL
jgi:hypothetical protein